MSALDADLAARVYRSLKRTRRELRPSIPSFNGDYDKWDEFCRKFDVLVHTDPRLTDKQKFIYLRNALTGPASQLISSIEFAPENYELAWKTVNDRFRNSRELKQHYISEMFNRKKMSANSWKELCDLIELFERNLAALGGLQAPVESWDLFTVHLLKSKLTPFLQQRWQELVADAKDEKLDAMMKYLREMLTFLKHCDMGKYGDEKNAIDKAQKKSCPMCRGDHDLVGCNCFIQLDTYARINTTLKLDCCFNCLLPGHDELTCKSSPCSICDKQHHKLLHLRIDRATMTDPDLESQESLVVVPAPSRRMSSQRVIDKIASMIFKSVLRPTALVYLYDGRGDTRHECRALLDSCAEQHWISRRMCERLGLDRRVTGWDKQRQELAEVRMRSRLGDFETQMLCRVTGDLDARRVPQHRWRELEHYVQIPRSMQLADPHFNRPRPVDLVIGVKQFYRLMSTYKRIRIYEDRLVLQESVLGWIVMGGPPRTRQDHGTPCNIM